ncbi:transporter, small conductance mechanosensitive ion channel MscS family protein, partial [Schaalia georgiae F0490]
MVTHALDIASLLLGSAVGAFIGLVIAVLVHAVARGALAKSAIASALLARTRTASYGSFLTWGGWIGLQVTLSNIDLTDWSNGTTVSVMSHLLLIAALACLTWVGYSAAWVVEDAAKLRQKQDKGRSRRFETQAQVIRRLMQVVISVVGLCAILGTFEAARQAMTTILASAGLVSVIAGLAAQQTLGNVFAGVLLAFTDAIRVGDVVVAGQKGETGSVEEITLSYVVVRVWDERRLITPCTYFTSTPFENWTRRAAAQLGTVELKLDWSAPVNLIRRKVEALLTRTDLWDGRTWTVQVTDSDQDTVTVRVLVSAKNSGTLSDLRTYLREHLIAWIVAEHPAARPARRFEPLRTVTVTHDPTGERAASLAEELAGIVGNGATGAGAALVAPPAPSDAPAPGSDASKTPTDAAHAARMVAARRKHKLARRRAMAERQRELAHGGPSQGEETQVMSDTAVGRVLSEGRVGVRPKSTDGPATAVHGIDRTRIMEAVGG